jgi:hypothetical protein
VTEQQQTGRTAVEQAVYDTLAEYNHRAHGVIGVPEPIWFLDWLRERGHIVAPIGFVDVLSDVVTALIRRTGSNVIELPDSERRADERRNIQITTDDDGCLRVEITTEVSE